MTATAKAAKSATKAAKTVKAPTAAAMARKRVIAERKEIVSNVRKIEKIRIALEKAAEVISKNGEDIKGDTGTQIAEILGKINVAVTVTNAAVEAEATALARTFVKR